MLFTVKTDKDGFVLSISHTVNDDIEIDIGTIEPLYLNAYKLFDGVLILDEERKAEIMAEEEQKEKEEEIAELKKNLEDTDYIVTETFEDIMALDNSVTFIVDFIRIVKQFSTTYASVLANRKAWRQRIKELSN